MASAGRSVCKGRCLRRKEMTFCVCFSYARSQRHLDGWLFHEIKLMSALVFAQDV